MDLYLIYTKLPEALQAWLSKLVYKPKIGKHCILRGKIFFRRQVDIGEYTVINTHAYLANIKIGKYCSVGKDFRTIIISHRIDLFTTQAIGCIYKKKYKKINSEYSPYLEGEIVIGNDVWIGENVTIIAPWGGKLVIGDGAVIGAGSIVTKDIPPYAVCVGSPAKKQISIQRRENPNSAKRTVVELE